MPVDATSTPRIPRRALGRFKWFALLIPFSAALLLYVDLENRRERSSCRAHMNAIAVALATYELKNPALAPERWHEYIVMEGLISAETLRCPADDLSDDSISYVA